MSNDKPSLIAFQAPAEMVAETIAIAREETISKSAVARRALASYLRQRQVNGGRP
jgi:hypothetical protein